MNTRFMQSFIHNTTTMVNYISTSSKRLAMLIALCTLGMSTMAFAQNVTISTAVTPVVDPVAGSIEGAGEYPIGEVAILTATPSAGYYFSHWNDDVKDNPREIVVEEAAAYTAVFVAYVEPDVVDMGFPSGTLWATFNLGATQPEEYGVYFAWGETMPKSEYQWSNYKFTEDAGATMTQYTTNGATILAAIDDAATVNLPEGWSMPTIDDIRDLADENKCTWTLVTKEVNGESVSGYEIVSKMAGYESAKIFLPLSGEMATNRGNTSNPTLGTQAHYVSTSLGTQDTKLYSLDINRTVTPSYSVGTEKLRSRGLSVRPIKKLIPCTIETEFIGEGLVEIDPPTQPYIGRVLTLRAIPGDSFYFVKWLKNGEDDVDENGVVNTRSVIEIIPDGNATYTAVFQRKKSVEEYVDLGLPSKKLWAKRNLGADTETDWGATYAAAETAPKQIYDWSTYKYATINGTTHTITKYNGNNLVIDAVDDAAKAWHPSYTLPTANDFQELIKYCTWVVEGNGYRVTSKTNDNSIYLPFTGYSATNGREEVNETGYYMSNTIVSPDNVSCLQLEATTRGMSAIERCKGLAVRPIYSSAQHTITVDILPKPEDAGLTVGEITIQNVSTTPATDLEIDANGQVKVLAGESIKITAELTQEGRDNGYEFVWWQNDEVEASSRTIEISQDMSFTALFDLKQYTVKANAVVDDRNTPAAATVVVKNKTTDKTLTSATKIVTHGDVVEVSVTPKDGYEFLSWTVTGTTGDESVEETADGKQVYKYTYTATDNVTIKANLKQNEYTITTVDPTGATLSGGGTNFHYGDEVTIILTPAAGYTFSSWTGVDGLKDGVATHEGDGASRIDKYTFTVTGNATISAVMTQNVYAITTVNPTGATLSGGGTNFHYGDKVTITLTPTAGYTFSSWRGVDGLGGSSSPDGANQKYTFTVTGNATISAVMKLNQFTINTKVSIPAGGSIELNPAGGTYTSGTEVTATLTLNAGYQLDSWTGIAGTQSGNTYMFTVTSAATLTANVSLKSYTDINFTVNNADWGSLTTSIASPYPHGAEVTLNAIPEEGYYFKQWSDGEKTATRKVTIPCASLRADFAPMAKPAVFAYDLKMQYNATDRTYAFTFWANTDATAGNIVFYQADGTMLTTKVAISSPIVAGKNIVVVPLSDIPFSEAGVLELNWGVEVSAAPITAMEDMYRESRSRYKNAYLAVDNSPESDYFGSMYIMHHWGTNAANSIYKYNPLFGNVGNYLRNTSINEPRRMAVDETGRVFMTDTSKVHPGIYVTNPPRYNTNTAFMEGTIGADGLITNGGQVIGGSAVSTFIYGKGKDAKLYVFNLHAGGTLLKKSVAVYRLGNEDGTLVDKITSVPEKVYKISGNGNSKPEGNLWVTSHGFFISFNRGKNNDSEYATALQFYDNNGVRQYSSAISDPDNTLIDGSSGGGFAVSADEKTLVLNNASGKFLVFDITWSGNKPILTKRGEYVHNLRSGTAHQMAFDYAGNLLVTGMGADGTHTRGFNAYVLPKADNREITPAKKALVVECKDIIFVAEQGTWNTAANWNTGVVPPADAAVVIAGQCTVNSTEAIQKVTIDGGKLIIAPTGALTIETTIVGADNVTDMLIQANASGNGTLIMKGYTEAVADVKATVEYFAPYSFYTTAYWNPVGIPTMELDGATCFMNSWICGLNDVSKDWDFITKATFKPFVGHILTQDETPAGKMYSMAGTLVYKYNNKRLDLVYSTGEITNEEAEAGDSFFANSWTAPIDLSTMTVNDFGGGAEATIYLIENGLYVPYSIEEHRDGVIKPMEAFFVKTEQETGSYITLDYDRHIVASATRAKKVARDMENKQTLNILVNAGEDKRDKLFLIQKNGYTKSFDNGADATKMLSSGYPNLSVQAATKELGILATDNWDSTLINFRKGDVETYTLSFEYAGDEDLILKDFFTGAQCDITAEATYTFEATDNDMGRFAIFKKPASSDVVTSLQDVWVSDDVLVFSNPAGERTDITVYTIDGKLVQTITTADTMTEINVPFHGVYLIKLSTATTTKTYKQIF